MEKKFIISESPITNFNSLLKNYPSSINLTIGDPFFKTNKKIKKGCKKYLNRNYTHYSNTAGEKELIKFILKYEKENNNMYYKENETLVTFGATEALFLSLSMILEKDDEVIIPIPYYSDYKQVIDYNQAILIPYYIVDYNYQLDKESLIKLITPKTKCIIINSPNNPNGSIFNDTSMKILYDIIKKYEIYILFDNCYEQIKYVNSVPNLSSFLIKNLEIKKYIIICNSFSKPYNMTGWRIGYLLASKELINSAKILHQTISVSQNTFIQYGALYSFKKKIKPNINYYQKNINYCYNKLTRLGLNVYKPEGAFYLFPSIEKFRLSSFLFCEKLLKEYGVAVMPGACFGMDKNIRISCAVKYKTLKKAMKKLEDFIKKVAL